MNNTLIQHAIENVWCTPDQDNQLIFKLARLTGYDGVFNTFTYHWDNISLPEKNKRFHIYHIGQIHPSLLNLLEDVDPLGRPVWVSFKTVCNNKLVTTNIYTEKGFEIPRFNSYYLVTDTHDVLFAVQKFDFFDFNNEDLYFRTYMNAYFSSIRQVEEDNKITTNGCFVATINDLLGIQSELNALSSVPGYTTCHINGYKQANINLSNAKVGDFIEYIHDSSIKKVVTLTVANLNTFDSEMDKKGKYLLHYPGNTNIIDYQDDIDIYLIQKSTGKGLYIHKNKPDTFRNITHKDYSLAVSYVNAEFNYLKNSEGMIDTNDLAIELHIRNSGYSRNLVYEVNKINELYKLNERDLLGAMLGVNSNVPVWKASNLESSVYVDLMNSSYNDITVDKVTNTYGYNSIASIFGNPLLEVKFVGLTRLVNVPVLYQYGCTAFEYDADGLLLGYQYYAGGTTYSCIKPSSYVEFIYGKGGDILDERVDNTININDEHRVYGKLDDKWSDVTNSTDYSVTGNNIIWSKQYTNTLVRSLSKFLCIEKTVDISNSSFTGSITIPIIYKQNVNGTIQDHVMEIPMGVVEVFLNGKSLIEGIDFSYDNFSVCVVNQSYLTNDVQNILIRFTGFCDNQLNTDRISDVGFIQQGRLSDNHHYDIKEGKVQRIIVNGCIKLPSVVNYYEENSDGSIFNNLNGKPYQIKDRNIPIKDLTTVDTGSIINKEDDVDQLISDYITLRIDQQSPVSLSVNTDKHYLYSPFLSTIIISMLKNIIVEDSIPDRVDTDYIMSVCKPYEHLLTTDPIKYNLSKDYIVIHPHPYNNTLSLTLKQYRLLDGIVNIYAKGLVVLVNQVKVN